MFLAGPINSLRHFGPAQLFWPQPQMLANCSSSSQPLQSQRTLWQAQANQMGS